MLGREEPEWPARLKPSHGTDRQRRPGCSEHPGDLPFGRQTTPSALILGRIPLTPQHIRIATISGREAIDAYVEGKDFEHWLFERFIPGLSRRLHLRAVQSSLENVLWQFNILKPGKSAPVDLIEKCLTLNARGQDGFQVPNLCRLLLLRSELRRQAAGHPELMLAFGLFQGAFRPYFDNLEVAVRMGDLAEHQKDTAHITFREAFGTFDTFSIFGVLLNLTLQKRHMLAGQHPAMPPHELTRCAIPQAWEAFWRSDLLRRDFPNGTDILPDGTTMRCTAGKILQYAHQHQHLERLFDFVCANRQAWPLHALLVNARWLAQDAVQWPEHNRLQYYAQAIASNPPGQRPIRFAPAQEERAKKLLSITLTPKALRQLLA